MNLFIPHFTAISFYLLLTITKFDHATIGVVWTFTWKSLIHECFFQLNSIERIIFGRVCFMFLLSSISRLFIVELRNNCSTSQECFHVQDSKIKYRKIKGPHVHVHVMFPTPKTRQPQIMPYLIPKVQGHILYFSYFIFQIYWLRG
jgi:hypothetical protein